jgi:microcystin-dependent protein
MFAGNFAPRGWALCDGQLLPIAQNTALFSLVGTTYGGDGRTTFGLPDLRGRAPMQPRQGPGLSNHLLGEKSGDETITLTQVQLPSHTHALRAADEDAEQTDPTGRVYAISDDDLYRASGTMVDMSAETTTVTGGGQSHSNMQPYLAINFIICLQGIYPSRN